MGPMQRLQEGVRVVLEAGLAPAERLAIADGVVDVSGTAVRGGVYQARTFAPRRPWRRPEPWESEMLLGQAQDEASGEPVSVVRAPAPVLAMMPRAQEAADSGEPLDALFVERLAESVHRWVSAAFHASRFFVVGAHRGTSDQQTATKEGELLVGLHVDNWERSPISSRHECRSRLCVNLGREDRFFLFINRPIHRMLDEVEIERAGNACELGEAFLATFSEYPVVSLRVRPGEAYIAPTENVLHDGSTRGSSSPDLIYTVLGDFSR